MSLVIAKIIHGKIQIESDTKISGENVIRNNPIHGRLKSLILCRNLVVGFAGDVALGEMAYKFFYERLTLGIELEDYILFLKELSESNQIDFILAGYSITPYIKKISKGEVEDSISAWIGDIDAFEEFQECFLTENLSESLSDRFTKAFGKVVRNQLNASVGEFHITTVTNLNDFVYEGINIPVFQYKIGSEVVMSRPKQIEISEKGIAVPLPSGNPMDGDYSISFFTNLTQDQACVGLYFSYGKFGLFYGHGNLFQSIKYNAIDAQDFINRIFDDYGYELYGFNLVGATLKIQYIGPKKN